MVLLEPLEVFMCKELYYKAKLNVAPQRQGLP